MGTSALGGNIVAMGVASVTIDPASVATITTAEQTFTVPGLLTTDLVWVNKPSLTAGLGVAGARVSAANTLAITFVNPTAGAIDAGSEVWRVLWIRAEGVAPGGATA